MTNNAFFDPKTFLNSESFIDRPIGRPIAEVEHPIASMFPLIGGDELDQLREDLRIHGLREPIVIYEGKILDGRNRWRACIQAGVEPRFERYEGDDPHAYVVSLNLHRRHLTTNQKRQVIDRLLMADPSKSNRQIATVAKVDHKTVGVEREKLEQRGEIPHVNTRTDTMGRSQPATKNPITATSTGDSNTVESTVAAIDGAEHGHEHRGKRSRSANEHSVDWVHNTVALLAHFGESNDVLAVAPEEMARRFIEVGNDYLDSATLTQLRTASRWLRDLEKELRDLKGEGQ